MKRNLGFGFHCHHIGKLVELVYDYKARVTYIKKWKPEKEQPLRLRLFKLIPLRKLPSAFRKFNAEWQKFGAEYQKFDAKWQKLTEYERRRIDAERRRIDAEVKELIIKYRPQIEKLHKELCPDCPWNGETIFTREDERGEWY